MALSSSNYTDLSHSMTSFLSSLGYQSSSTPSNDTAPSSSCITATTDPATSSHQQQEQEQQQQRTPSPLDSNSNNEVNTSNNEFQQSSWKSESFMGLLNLLSTESVVGAQTITTNSNIATLSDNMHPWGAFDSGSDWESEQLRSLLNLSDQDMDLFQIVDESLLSSTSVEQMQAEFLSQQQVHLQQHHSSVDDSNTSRRHSASSSLYNTATAHFTTAVTASAATHMVPTMPPTPVAKTGEIKRPDTKESFVHPGFYTLSSPSQQLQPQRPSLQHSQSHGQGTHMRMAMKRAFREDDTCPTSTSTTMTVSSPSSSSSLRHHHHHSHGPTLQGGVDLRRHSVDGYHVAAKAAAAAGSTSPAPPYTYGAYSTPPKTPNSLPTSKFHPHARASTADYSQVPPGQPFMATNRIIATSPLMGASGSSPASSPSQPVGHHIIRLLSSPAGTKLSSAASALSSPPTSTTTNTSKANGSINASGNNSNSGTPRKRHASKFRIDNHHHHHNGAFLSQQAGDGMIPFDPTALLSHFGLVNTLPPPLQQQHPSHSSASPGFLHLPLQSEHAILYQQQLQAALRRQQHHHHHHHHQQQQQQQQQHQQFAAAAAAAIGAAGGGRGGNNSVAGQNAHAFLMHHLIADPRLAAAGGMSTSHNHTHNNSKQTTAVATTYRRNPGEVPSSTLPPDHFIFQEALLTQNRQQAAEQHAQQQQQAQQAQQAKQQAQAQAQHGHGRVRSNSISPTTTTMGDEPSSKVHRHGINVASRRRSEPVSLFRLHQQRLLQAQQQKQLQQQQQQQRLSGPQSEQSRSNNDQQQQQLVHQQQQQQQHLAMIVEINSPYATPISARSSSSLSSSSSSPSSSSACCESAIPCGPVSTPNSSSTATTTTATTTAPAIEATAEATENSAPLVADFNKSLIATGTKTVEASIVADPKSSLVNQGKIDMDADINANVEIPLTSPVDHLEAETKDKVEEEDKSTEKVGEEKEKEEHKTAGEQKGEQVEKEAVEEEEEEEELKKNETKQEEGPLSAAEAFAKSLTAVTTTLDPAATQLMDQLRLQEHLRASTLPNGTSTTTTLPTGSKM
ncbi:MAG: hypothetical protein J3R72DRAFT_473188 [Linnemannia gamsii]|nr:MAG: hypothetical protein J3R72DRAFT_473188 [Linnemannia gamsii]